MYLLDAPTLGEVLRAAPSPALIRRLAGVPTRDRWTSVVAVSQLLVAARVAKTARVMQDVIRLIAAVRVAPFDLTAAQHFAKLRAGDADAEDAMHAAIALANDFTVVTTRLGAFVPLGVNRVENWVGERTPGV